MAKRKADTDEAFDADNSSNFSDTQDAEMESDVSTEKPAEKKQKLNDGASRNQEQKEKKHARQLGKTGGDLLVRAKRVWADLRSGELDRKQKVSLVDETLVWLKPNIQDVIIQGFKGSLGLTF
jgi:hypothetical protein